MFIHLSASCESKCEYKSTKKFNTNTSGYNYGPSFSSLNDDKKFTKEIQATYQGNCESEKTVT